MDTYNWKSSPEEEAAPDGEVGETRSTYPSAEVRLKMKKSIFSWKRLGEKGIGSFLALKRERG